MPKRNDFELKSDAPPERGGEEVHQGEPE